MLARTLAEPVTTPRKQARVVALVLQVQTLKHRVCCHRPRAGEKWQGSNWNQDVAACGLKSPESHWTDENTEVQ